MKHFGAFIGAVVVSLMVGCGPVDEQVSLEQELAADAPVPDAEMLQAFAAACPPSSTNSCVNLGYGSCTAWSAYADCGEITECDGDNVTCRKRICEPDRACYTVTTGTQFQNRSRYRVCFNPAQQSCTEYDTSFYSVCGCAGTGL